MQEDKFNARKWIQIREPYLPTRSASLTATTLSQLKGQLGFAVTAEMLADRDFRQKHSISLASDIPDSAGTEVFELDIIAIGDPNDFRNYHLLRYGWYGPEQPFTLHRAGEVVNWSSGTAQKCTRIGNYHEKPDEYKSLMFTHFI